MLYTEFAGRAAGLTITQADNGLFYLEPMWRNILQDNMLSFDKVSDFEVTPDIIEDFLKLEVKRRNTSGSNRPYVEDWLFDLITATVEPAVMQEETEYVKQVVEFMKANHKLNTGDTDGDKELNNIIQFPKKDEGDQDV